ncbi:MAG: hypothetical protein WA417_13455 [Stellaceae bacterium]
MPPEYLVVPVPAAACPPWAALRFGSALPPLPPCAPAEQDESDVPLNHVSPPALPAEPPPVTEAPPVPTP